MKIKTQDLIGKALDWAVAKCEGHAIGADYGVHPSCTLSDFDASPFSTNPSQSWPIIERERIGVWPSDTASGMWAARPDYKIYPKRLPPHYGPTSLVAAMRCYVASKLGDEVDIPEELL